MRRCLRGSRLLFLVYKNMKLIKENIPFTMVANEVLCNKNLSFKAKGLYAYLFSKPDTWDFSGDRITMETVDGRKAIFSALRELEKSGFLSRDRLPNGKMEYNLKFSSKNLLTKTVNGIGKPIDQNSQVPKRLSGEMGSISNIEEKVINKDIIIQKESTLIFKNRYSEFQNVSLSLEEVSKLYERLGDQNTKILIEELGCYLASTNKRYASHYATLLAWARRKVGEHQKGIKQRTII